MKETLITFETAKLTKEKGFDWIVSEAYDLEGNLGNYYDIVGEEPFTEDNTDYDALRHNAPTQEVLKKWLREKHNIHMTVDLFPHTEKEKMYQVHGDYKNGDYWNWVDYDGNGTFSNYEDALEFGLQEGLKLIP
jgi:hypothetical protein